MKAILLNNAACISECTVLYMFTVETDSQLIFQKSQKIAVHFG